MAGCVAATVSRLVHDSTVDGVLARNVAVILGPTIVLFAGSGIAARIGRSLRAAARPTGCVSDR